MAIIDSIISASDAQEAVNQRHIHANAATLNKFGESGGQPTFNGNPIGGATPIIFDIPENSQIELVPAKIPLGATMYLHVTHKATHEVGFYLFDTNTLLSEPFPLNGVPMSSFKLSVEWIPIESDIGIVLKNSSTSFIDTLECKVLRIM